MEHQEQKTQPLAFVYLKTFGCRTNLFDTEIMRACLKDFALAQNEEQADIVIVNSCTVTNNADSSVRSYIRKINQLGKRVYLGGCGVPTQGQALYEEGLVESVFSHAFKEEINELLKQKQRFFKTSSQPSIDTTLVSEFVGKSRAFIKIQEGCDFACSYCIIPFVRGVARSQKEEKILQQIHTLCESGFSEFILTGTNMGSYGRGSEDQKHAGSLASLIKKIARIQGVKRIRLGSLEPSQIDSEFQELLTESFMARHLHIALQHTSDRMLEIMNRKNRFGQDRQLFEEIAQKGYALGTDYIIAHPGESEEVFHEGLKNLQSLPLTHIHPFIYSKRSGTASALLNDSIRKEVAKERLQIIKHTIEENNFRFRKRIQAEKIPLQILIENTDHKGYASGLDQFFNRMILSHHQENKWMTVCDYSVERENNYAKN